MQQAISKSVAAITADSTSLLFHAWLISFVTQVRVALDLRLLAARGQTRRQMVISVSALLFSAGLLSRLISSAYGSGETEFNDALLPPTGKSGVSATVGETGECCYTFVCNSVFCGSMCLKLWYNFPIFIVFKFKLLKILQLLNSFCKLLSNRRLLLQPYAERL